MICLSTSTTIAACGLFLAVPSQSSLCTVHLDRYFPEGGTAREVGKFLYDHTTHEYTDSGGVLEKTALGECVVLHVSLPFRTSSTFLPQLSNTHTHTHTHTHTFMHTYTRTYIHACMRTARTGILVKGKSSTLMHSQRLRSVSTSRDARTFL